MRLGAAHEMGIALSTLSAYAIVLLGGELPPVAWGLIVVPPLSAWLRTRGWAAPGLSGTLLALTSLALGFAQIATAGIESAVLGGGIALVGILAARQLTRTTLAHDLQALLVALLVVMAGSVLNTGLTYGPVFVVFAITSVWALTTRQLLMGAEAAALSEGKNASEVIRARRDVVTPLFFAATGGVALVILASTALIFLAFPRIGFGNLGLPSSRTASGFPASISLRGAPRVAAGNDDVVARVRGIERDTFDRGLYLRGAVYEAVSEQGFAQLEPAPEVPRRRLELANAPTKEMYEVFLYPVAGDLLFTLGPFTNARALSGGHPNPNRRMGIVGNNERGELMAARRLASPVRYVVRGAVSAPGYIAKTSNGRRLIDAEKAPALFALPGGTDPRLIQLADQIVGDAKDEIQKAERLRRFFLEQFTYTLSQPNADKESPMVSFLLEDRRGHCEYFAAAYALLLRTQGVASRVVGGYQGGAWDETEDLVVFTGRNAHAWVEWYLPGIGWIVDDATPAATATRDKLAGVPQLLERIRRFWDDNIVDYALLDQRMLLRDATRTFGGLAFESSPERLARGGGAVLAAVGLLILWRRIRRRREEGAGDVNAVAAAMVRALKRLEGREVDAASTLREAVGHARRLGPHRPLFDAVLKAYEADRFGARPMKPASVDEAIKALDALVPVEG